MTPSGTFDETVQTVGLNRRKGDALASRGRAEDAARAYNVGLQAIDRELDNATLTRADEAELLGMRGGLLRRLGMPDEALVSYQRGASLERDAALATTYNRSNAIKLGLIAGTSTLDDLQLELADLGAAIERTIHENERAASDAWMYADLGDTFLLLGNVPRAIDAYRTFNERSRSDSPTTTLSVLHDIGRALEARGDARAERFVSDLQHIEAVLASSK